MVPEQKEENYRLAEKLLSEQNFRNAVVAGLLATIITVVIWAVIAGATGHIMGYLVIVLGFVVGWTIRFFGKGIDAKFVVLAAALAGAGCVLGNVMAAILVEAVDHQIPVMTMLRHIPVRAIVSVTVANLSYFGLIDLMFWIIAISEAGYFAARRLTSQQHFAIFTLRNK